jgi:hypothetical protein
MEPEGSLLHLQVPAYSNVRLSCIVNLADFFSVRFVVNILACIVPLCLNFSLITTFMGRWVWHEIRIT